MENATAATHPVLTCAHAIDEALKSVGDVEPVFMTVTQKAEALLSLTRLADQVTELRGRVLVVADDVADVDASRDPAAWLAHHARLDAGPRRAAALGVALERWSLVGAGIRGGTVNIEQAVVITHALDELPSDLDADTRVACEERLVAEAAHFGPRELRVMGRRILDLVDPDAAESREADALDQEEREACRTTYLRWRRNGDGTTDFRGRVSDAVFSRLLAYLEAFTSPRRPADGAASEPGSAAGAGPANPDDRRPYDQRMGAAFGSFLEAVDPHRLPLHGGDATTVVVTIDLEALRTQLAGIGLVGDEPLTAAETRRLACQAGIIPAVLGSDSQILDLGRTSRLAKPHQRKALAARHPICQAAGCTIPNTWCEAHHRDPWSQGGQTDLEDLVLLCSFHHHRAHDAHYDVGYPLGGEVSFHRRT